MVHTIAIAIVGSTKHRIGCEAFHGRSGRHHHNHPLKGRRSSMASSSQCSSSRYCRLLVLRLVSTSLTVRLLYRTVLVLVMDQVLLLLRLWWRLQRLRGVQQWSNNIRIISTRRHYIACRWIRRPWLSRHAVMVGRVVCFSTLYELIQLCQKVILPVPVMLVFVAVISSSAKHVVCDLRALDGSSRCRSMYTGSRCK